MGGEPVSGMAPPFVLGSGNVFEDLGLRDAQELELRSDLKRRILEIVHQNGWTQEEAARRMGCSRPDVSRLENNRIDRFSVGRLLRLLRAGKARSGQRGGLPRPL